MLTQSFPQVKVVVDAPVQMEKEVAALRQVTGAASGRDLEAMLGALSTVAPPERPVSGLDFVNGELRVKGLALRPEQAQSIAGALKGQGYSSALQGDALVINPETLP
jgi:general secretion pathway protein L